MPPLYHQPNIDAVKDMLDYLHGPSDEIFVWTSLRQTGQTLTCIDMIHGLIESGVIHKIGIVDRVSSSMILGILDQAVVGSVHILDHDRCEIMDTVIQTSNHVEDNDYDLVIVNRVYDGIARTIKGKKTIALAELDWAGMMEVYPPTSIVYDTRDEGLPKWKPEYTNHDLKQAVNAVVLDSALVKESQHIGE
jgi:hypothetical protein